jgi:hypothetical protein
MPAAGAAPRKRSPAAIAISRPRVFRNALTANWHDFAVGFRCARDVAATASPASNP